MKTIAIKYHESVLAALNLSPQSFENEAKTALAVKLYEIGRLTSGQAAELAGLSRVALLLNCLVMGLKPLNGIKKNWKQNFRMRPDDGTYCIKYRADHCSRLD